MITNNNNSIKTNNNLINKNNKKIINKILKIKMIFLNLLMIKIKNLINLLNKKEELSKKFKNNSKGIIKEKKFSKNILEMLISNYLIPKDSSIKKINKLKLKIISGKSLKGSVVGFKIKSKNITKSSHKTNKDSMTSKLESSEPTKKYNKSSYNLTGINKNSNNGPSLENKKNKITSFYKNIVNRMMLKSDNLIFKFKS